MPLPPFLAGSHRSLGAGQVPGRRASPQPLQVRKSAAEADGKTLDTRRVNRAIEAAAATGGGVVVFPGGIVSLFFSYPLEESRFICSGAGQRNRGCDSPMPGDLTG